MFQPVERSFVYLQCLSLFILVIVLLAGFYLDIEKLKAIGIIYGLMLLTPLFMSSKIEVEKKTLFGIVVGVPALIICAVAVSVITKNFEVMGVLRITEWSAEEAAKYPLTLRLGALALSLGISPNTLLSLLVNIPGPVAEESFFRIFFMNTLTPIMGKWRTLVAQAILFGITHWFAYNINIIGIVTASICGAILGVIYLATGSETAVAISHILYNAITILTSV